MGRLRGRLRRLLRALLAQEAPDDAFALRFLEGEERELYLAMDPRDRAHGVRVARRLLKAYPEAPGYAVRAALLHDAGKAVRPYRTLERVLAGLFAPPLPLPSGGASSGPSRCAATTPSTPPRGSGTPGCGLWSSATTPPKASGGGGFTRRTGRNSPSQAAPFGVG